MSVIQKLFYFAKMSLIKQACCLFFLSIGFSEAAIVNSKCALNDGECQKKLFKTTLRSHAESGIPEVGINSIDPYKCKDTTVSFVGLVNLTIVDGEVDGISKCEFVKYETDIEKRHTITECLCDSITIQGHYNVASGPLISTITSKGFSGDGHGKIQIDKASIQINMPFDVEKHADGEIYLVPKTSEAQYSIDVTDKISFEADNIIIGNQEVSKTIVPFLNNNWKMVYGSFAKVVTDRILLEYYENLKKFFVAVPAKEYLTNDLSNYVKN